MTIIEMYPYIMGKKFSREATEPYRVDVELFDSVYSHVKLDTRLQILLDSCNNPSTFFKASVDLSANIKREYREELFFCLKNGFATREVPAKCIWYVREAYKRYQIPNLIPKLIPEKVLDVFFQENYFVGKTLYDVICNFAFEDYKPFSPQSYRSSLSEDFEEIYIAEKDMVAVFPKAITSKLSDNDIKELHVSSNGITLNGKHLSLMGGYHGASRSIYDNRELF